MTDIDISTLKRVLNYLLTEEGVKYSVQYIDNPKDEWTVPILLTEERAEKLIDASISKIRFSFPDSEIKATFAL